VALHFRWIISGVIVGVNRPAISETPIAME
jgi:hypothetical protein